MGMETRTDAPQRRVGERAYMTDEKDQSHADARSLSNAGLGSQTGRGASRICTNRRHI